MPPTEERELIRQAQRGDRAAFEELVRRYDRVVLRLALSIVRREEDARDIYQETFLRAYRSLASFRQESRFETWLFRIVTNACLDHLRRGAAGPAGAAGAGLGEAGPGGDPIPDLADDRPDHDPERALQGKRIGVRISDALGRLAPRERLVFGLRHTQGLRLRAIAEILETSDETARNCLYRAHRELRVMLADLRDLKEASR